MNAQLFRKLIDDKGLSIQSVADAMQIHNSTLYRKMQDGGSAITVGQAEIFREITGASGDVMRDIFFPQELAEMQEKSGV